MTLLAGRLAVVTGASRGIGLATARALQAQGARVVRLARSLADGSQDGFLDLGCDLADVAATLRARLGVERPPLKILGACNPTLAHRALEFDPSVSLLLPCNVVVEAVPDGTRVAAADPRELMADPRFAELTDEAARRLQAAVDEVARRLG